MKASSSKNKNRSTSAVLIDGEHYLPNTKKSLEVLEKKYKIKYLIFIGGTEKIGTNEEIQNFFSYPVFFINEKKKINGAFLEKTLHEKKVEMVLDLSDEPVVNYESRFQLANSILSQGCAYKGADFEFSPLHFKTLTKKPSLAIWGTGKRIGKTALGGFVARTLKEAKRFPAVVTLSRGGPDNPILVRGDQIKIDTDYLLNIDKKGMHASSDCFEDALTARVPTFGCRRCGGGMSGRVFVSIIDKGVLMAEKSKDIKTIIIEGSGASVPEIKTSKVLLAMNATQLLNILTGYLTPLKIKYADIIVITMCENFLVKQKKLNTLIKKIKEINPNVKIATTVLRPRPLGNIQKKRIFLATTMDEKSLRFIKKYIEKKYDCEVVGVSGSLSEKQKLQKDLKKLDRADIFVSELKAAAISIGAKEAQKKGKPVVFLDYDVEVVERGGDIKDLKKEIKNLEMKNQK